MADVVDHSVLVLLGLAVVPVLDRTIVAGDAAVDLSLVAADRAGELLAGQIAVILTYGVCRRHCVVRKLVILRDLADKVRCRFPVGKLLSEERVENGSGSIQSLQIVLNIQSGENILRVAHRKVGGIRVVGLSVHVRRDDVRELLLVVQGEPIGRGLRRRRFQVVEVAVHLLVIGQALSHVIEHIAGKSLGLGVREVRAQPLRVQADLVHADQADG